MKHFHAGDGDGFHVENNIGMSDACNCEYLLVFLSDSRRRHEQYTPQVTIHSILPDKQSSSHSFASCNCAIPSRLSMGGTVLVSRQRHDRQHRVSFEQVRIKFITDKQARGASRSPLHFDTLHAAEAYIQRLQATAGLMPRGWVFLLEDDVWAIQAVEEKDLRYDISGTCWAIYKPEYGAIIKNETSLCYGGYGGHFINSSRLLGLSASRYRPLIADLLAAFSPIASDELLSAVILQDGGTIGYYTGFYEHLVGDGPMRTQHQMKWFYSWWTS